MEQDYSNKDIDGHFKEVYHRFDDQSVKLDDLNEKVGIQNGRVRKLENRSSWMTGLGVAAMIFVGLIITLVVYSFQLSQENLRQSIILELQK